MACRRRSKVANHNEEFVKEFVGLDEDDKEQIERFLRKWVLEEFFDTELAAQHENFRRKVGGKLMPKKSRAGPEKLLQDAGREHI